MRRYLILLFLSTYALAQGARYDNFNVTSATNVNGSAQATLFTLPYSRVTVCAYPDDGGTPCGNAVPAYADEALTQPLANPIKADVHGRFGFWLAPGTYAYSVQDAGGKFVGTYAITLGSQVSAPDASAVHTNPTGSQTITQPSGTTLSVTSTGSATRTEASPLWGVTLNDASQTLRTSSTMQGDTHLTPVSRVDVNETGPNDDATYENFTCNFTGTGSAGNCIPHFFIVGNTAGDKHVGIWGGNAIVAMHANTPSFGWEVNPFNLTGIDGDILPNGTYTAGPFWGNASTAGGSNRMQGAYVESNVPGAAGFDYGYVATQVHDGAFLCGLPGNAASIPSCVTHSATGIATPSANFGSAPDTDIVHTWTGSQNGIHSVVTRSTPGTGSNPDICRTIAFDGTVRFKTCASGTMQADGNGFFHSPSAGASVTLGQSYSDTATPAQLSMSVDPTGNGSIQAIVQGTGYQALALNPNGGSVTANGSPICTVATGCTGGTDTITAGVPSVNSITSAVTLAAGSGINITPSGSTLTIAATGTGGNPQAVVPVGGAWSTTTAYIPGSVVSHNSEAYLSLTNNNNSVPETHPTDWYLIPGTGGGTAPTGPANMMPAFNQGTGETPRTLGSTNLTNYDTGNSLDVPTTLSTGHLKVVQENCAFDAIDSINGNVCEIHNNNTNAGGTSSANFQQTGAGRNSGPILGALYNVGWTHAQPFASAATFLTRGLHFMDGDAGQGMNCQSIGDCIYHYNYLNYIGGCCAPSDEAVKNDARINTEYPGFYRGTSATLTDNNAPGGSYPSGAHKVTMTLNGSTAGGQTNIIGDGTTLMGDPTVNGTTACQFNGNPTTWTAVSGVTIGMVPVTGCTGAAIPAINAWGSVTTATDGALLGDLPDSGARTANIPGQQSFVITPGTGSGAFTAPDGTNSWSNFVCLKGQYFHENSRITAYNAATHTMTANIRNSLGANVAVMQGPACAPYQAISIDVDLANSPQASSYTSFGSPDGGAHLLFSESGLMLRQGGDTPETTTSTFHLVPKSEIVANTAPNVFSGSPQLQKEDNGWNPATGTSLWNPHPVNNPDEVFSAYDHTGQYNNSGYASGTFVTGAGGPRVTGGYLVNSFINGNDYPMYQHFGGWASLPSRISGAGIFSSLLTNDRVPWDNVVFTGDWMPGQTSVNLFNVAGRRVVLRKITGTTQMEYDFASDGADSVRASYFSIPKTDPSGNTAGTHIGLCAVGTVGICVGSTASLIGLVSQDGSMNLDTLTANKVVGPATAPTGSCTAGMWEFTQDGKGSFCKAGTWEVVFTAP